MANFRLKLKGSDYLFCVELESRSSRDDNWQKQEGARMKESFGMREHYHPVNCVMLVELLYFFLFALAW